MNISLRCVLLSWTCCTMLACDGFGHPIVGRIPRSLAPIKCGEPPPSCDQIPVLGVLTPPAGPDFSVAACGDRGSDCGPLGNPSASFQNCDLTSEISEATASSLRMLLCTRATLTVAPGTTTLELDQWSVQNSELTLIATSAVTIELSHASLSMLRLELRGPIDLRISDGSQVSNTQITDTTGAASLELRESKALESSFVGFRDMASFVRATLNDSSVFASTVQLQNVSLLRTDIATDQLSAVELKGSDLTLEVGSGSIAGANFQRLKLQKCGSLFIEGSTFYHSTFAACSEKLVIDRGAIGSSTVFGAIESHVMNWLDNLFASGTPASLVSWGDTLSNNRFCADTGKIQIGSFSDLTCNFCDEVRADPAELFCTVPDPDPNSFANGTGTTDYAPRAVTYQTSNPNCPTLEMPPPCAPLPVDSNPF